MVHPRNKMLFLRQEEQRLAKRRQAKVQTEQRLKEKAEAANAITGGINLVSGPPYQHQQCLSMQIQGMPRCSCRADTSDAHLQMRDLELEALKAVHYRESSVMLSMSYRPTLAQEPFA